ncbi:hypothetical protein [Winogradskyella sp.]|uniref:hypothetical protein n=1 Tax=Winogradskyella sp. TaxID=1883156 RepID=UPI003BA99080
MRDYLYPLLFFCTFLIFQCNSSPKNQTQTESKIYNFRQQGWKSNKIIQLINDISYSATEVPLQYYLLKNTQAEDLTTIDSLYELNKDERIIEIEFQHIDKKDLLLDSYTNKTYEDAVKYMAFQITNDFKVVTSSGDTINCSGSHFERNFKVAPFKRALLYFDNINPDDHIQLLYQDHLFGNGMIKFNFKDTPLKL